MKKSKEWIEQDRKIKREALIINIRLHMLLEERDYYMRLVDAHVAKFDREDSDWKDQEDEAREAESIYNKIKESRDRLIGLEEEYDDLRKRANKFYGREVMKDYSENKTPPLTSFATDEPDGADWWKQV